MWDKQRAPNKGNIIGVLNSFWVKTYRLLLINRSAMIRSHFVKYLNAINGVLCVDNFAVSMTPRSRDNPHNTQCGSYAVVSSLSILCVRNNLNLRRGGVEFATTPTRPSAKSYEVGQVQRTLRLGARITENPNCGEKLEREYVDLSLWGTLPARNRPFGTLHEIR